MHSVDEAMVRAFIAPHRRERWLSMLEAPKRRARFLDKLNHCRDFDPRYATELPSNADVLTLLVGHGAPPTCHLVSAAMAIDGCEFGLVDGLNAAAEAGWGTVVNCLPGQLAFFLDECGSRRLLLHRPHSE